MNNVLVVIGKTRRKIYIPKERYKPIIRHNKMQNKLLEIQETLYKPDIILRSLKDEKVRDYYKHYK